MHTTVDMKKLFDYLRYKVEHEKRYSIYTSYHVLFCLLYLHTDNDILDNFPKICRKVAQTLLSIFENFPKISEDNWRLQKTKLNNKIWRCFNQWMYINTAKYNLRDLLCSHSDGDLVIFLCEDITFSGKSSPGVSLWLYNKIS